VGHDGTPDGSHDEGLHASEEGDEGDTGCMLQEDYNSRPLPEEGRQRVIRARVPDLEPNFVFFLF
jgi:hypothetical protein